MASQKEDKTENELKTKIDEYEEISDFVSGSACRNGRGQCAEMVT